MIVIATISGIVLGFIAGLFCFKVKTRWCDKHGVVKTCQLCTGNRHDYPVGARVNISGGQWR